MTRFLRVLGVLLPLALFGAANDVQVSQRKADDSGFITRTVAPDANGLLGFNGSKLPISVTVSGGLSLSGGVLSGPSGTISSVSLTLPNIFAVTGSPLTSNGTISGTLANQNANLVFASPASGPAAPPSFRALALADLPDLSSTFQAANATLSAVAGGTYTGDDSIATLGTITAGVWNGTVIPETHGGAGDVDGVLKANGSGVVSAAAAGTDYLAPAAIGTTIQAYNANLTTWAGKTAPSGDAVGTSDTQTLTNKSIAGSQLTGGYASAGLTMATDRLLGRTTAGTGVVEEITVGPGLVLSDGVLEAVGGGSLLVDNNLSDVDDAPTAFANIKQAATTSATGVVELATDGETSAGVVVQGNDSRLSNSRAPTAHAASHASDGSDPITIAQSQVTGLVTDLSGKQPLDADLTAFAALTSATDRLPYFTGSGTMDVTGFTSAARSLLDDASAAAMRGTLGLIIGTDVQAYDADLTSWAAKTAPSGTVVGTTDVQALTNKTIDFADNTIAGLDVSTMVEGILPVANGGTGVGTLTGLVMADGTNPFAAAVDGTDYLSPAQIGVSVQAYDADLDTWATKTAPSGDVVGTTDTQTLTNKSIAGSQLTGAYTASGMTMATSRVLGRATASTGPVEELTVTGTGSVVLNDSPAFTTHMQLPASTSPTTGSAGRVAFDTNIWAASHGAVQVHNGTATTYLIGVEASDTPTDGQVPKFNSDGTITWEDDDGGSGSGDVVGPSSATDNALVRFDATTGKLVQDSNVTLADSGTAFAFSGAGGITAGGSDTDVTLTPQGAGQVRAVNRLYVGEGSVAYSGLQSLIIAREGNDFGGALGVHHGSNATNNFAWTFQRARGTLASPSAVQSGDRLGQFTFAGWHSGGAYSNSAAILADAAENFGSNRGVELSFETIPAGSSTRTMALKIDGSQYVLMKNGWRVGTASSSAATGSAVVYGTDTASATLSIRRADATTGSGAVYFSKSRGSMGSPSVPLSGDRLGAIAAGGYTGSSWVDTQALFGFTASENWGGSNQGTSFTIGLVPNGSTTRADVFSVQGTGLTQIGAGTPAASFLDSTQRLLQVRESSSNTLSTLTASSTSTDRGILQSLRSRGTLASPSAVQSGDYLWSLRAGGYDGSTMQQGIEIAAIVDGAVSSGVVPQRLEFQTTSTTGGSRAVALTIKGNGTVQANKTFYAAEDVTADKTITAGGTTGARTINKNAGSVNFAASATSLVVTNSRVTAASVILATVATDDTTMHSVQVVAGSGSFTLYAQPAAPTAETRVNFFVVN